MQPEVRIVPECAECGEFWLPGDTDRWVLKLDVNDELVWFCPECDEREFAATASSRTTYAAR